MSATLRQQSLILLGILLITLGGISPAPGAGGDEISIDAGYPDTLRVVAANYKAKAGQDYDLISCIGPIAERPDSGIIFLSSDTAFYLGLPSPDTYGRSLALAAASNHVLILRNLTEGYNASRMFDISKFDIIILNAPEVGDGVISADLRRKLGKEVKGFEMHYELVPNKVLFLTAPACAAEVKSVTGGAGVYKTIIKFDAESMSAACYWLADATFALKIYNPKTNGKILTLADDVAWDKLMGNPGFANDINADKISAVVMPSKAPVPMVKKAAKAGVQRMLVYLHSKTSIDGAPKSEAASLANDVDGLSLINCLLPDIKLFWYQT